MVRKHGKQVRGKYQCIALPPKSAAPTQLLDPLQDPSLYHTSLPVDSSSGKVATPWIGKDWSTVKLGGGPKNPTPTYEEMKARFPGIGEDDDDAQRQLFGADGDASMEDESSAVPASASTPKKPVTSLSRSSASKAKSRTTSRAASRVATPASSTPGSPSLGAQSSMSDSATPSRITLSGATWKSPGHGNPLASPAHSLLMSSSKSKTLNKSWNAKRKARDNMLEARDLQRRVNEAEAEKRREAARAAAQRAAYKKEQETKNQHVQVISDTRKIKKMSRKQLRTLSKMDTSQLNKVSAVTSQILSRGTVPKGQ